MGQTCSTVGGDSTASSDIPEIIILPILRSAPTVLVGDQYRHYLASVNFGRFMISFCQLFRLKHCINYVSSVKIDFDAHVDILGQIITAKYSIVVIL